VIAVGTGRQSGFSPVHTIYEIGQGLADSLFQRRARCGIVKRWLRAFETSRMEEDMGRAPIRNPARRVGPKSVPETGREETLLKRIEEISRSARSIWFIMLGALVFASITLTGINDIDFFGIDRTTQLPLLNVTVPVTYFFIGGATLIAAIYIYLHLYLEMLWPELARAPARIGGTPLVQRVYPWLISEWALRRRDRLQRNRARKNGEAPPQDASIRRPLAWIGTALSVVLVWAFGPLVLFWLWWRSAVAHDNALNLWLALMFAFSSFVGLRSWFAAAQQLADGHSSATPLSLGAARPYVWAMAVLILLLFFSSLLRTGGEWIPGENVEWKDHGEGQEAVELRRLLKWHSRDGGMEYWNKRLEYASTSRQKWQVWVDRAHSTFFAPYIVKADLVETRIAIRPDDWLDREEEKKEFRAHWATREGLDYSDPFPAREWPNNHEEIFNNAWKDRRGSYLDGLKKPVLDGRHLAGAQMEKAFLPGVLLRGANMKGVGFFGAVLEGADFSGASLERAGFVGASLEGANLIRASVEGADLRWARLDGASLHWASLEDANLSWARLEGAHLFRARLEGANLFEASLGRARLVDASLEGAHLKGARFEGADLSGVGFEGADLSGAGFEGADLSGAGFEGARLSGARLFGAENRLLNLSETRTLKAADFSGTALRNVDLSGKTKAELAETENFDLSFGDASVKLPDGVEPPCQWSRTVLADDEYFGRWAGWLDASTGPRAALFGEPRFRFDFAWLEPIPPPKGCQWPGGTTGN